VDILVTAEELLRYHTVNPAKAKRPNSRKNWRDRILRRVLMTIVFHVGALTSSSSCIYTSRVSLRLWRWKCAPDGALARLCPDMLAFYVLASAPANSLQDRGARFMHVKVFCRWSRAFNYMRIAALLDVCLRGGFFSDGIFAFERPIKILAIARQAWRGQFKVLTDICATPHTVST